MHVYLVSGRGKWADSGCINITQKCYLQPPLRLFSLCELVQFQCLSLQLSHFLISFDQMRRINKLRRWAAGFLLKELLYLCLLELELLCIETPVAQTCLPRKDRRNDWKHNSLSFSPPLSAVEICEAGLQGTNGGDGGGCSEDVD